jgi:NAD(P)-dependent dehydrogenase (short-subunit alcohol dehydrogenase family)
MTKQTAIVTGASAGVGKAAARQLLGLGWRVIGVGRNPARCAAAEAELADPDFTMLRADMALLADVARLGNQIAALAPRIDALCNNAGGVVPERRVTAEGFEETLASNHLAPFFLTLLLLPCLGPGSRVIATSSEGHEQCPAINWDDLNFELGWASGRAYCQAKLGNVLFTRELARRYGPQGLIAHALHPGLVDSNFVNHCEPGMKAYMESIQDRAISPDAAASALAWLASGEWPGSVNGRYFAGMKDIAPSPAALDDRATLRLWEVSEALVAPYLPRPSATMRNSS